MQILSHLEMDALFESFNKWFCKDQGRTSTPLGSKVINTKKESYHVL